MIHPFEKLAWCIIAGIGVGLVIVSFIPLQKEPVEKFKVVDNYGTCAIVRYTDPSQQWHYFLDCGNQHLNE